MADRVLVDSAPGMKSWLHFDALGHEIDVRYDEFDTDFAKAQIAHAAAAPIKGEWGRQERVIPMHVLDKMIREKWGKEDVRRWANSPEGMFCGVPHNGKVNRL